MRLAPLLALLALGCSSPTPSTDAGAAPPDTSADVASLPDAPDAQQLPDVTALDTPDVWMGTDPVPIEDAADAASTDTIYAVAVPDAAQEDTVDVLAMDAPDVAIAAPDVPETMDTPDVVQLADVVDVQPDRPDVADVPRDTGPADAGPVLYDLDQARTALEVRAVFRRVSLKGELDCEVVADMTACRVESNTLHLSLRACGRTFAGLIPLSTTTGRVVTVTPGAPYQTSDISPVVAPGTTSGARRSFRIGVVAPQNGATPGVTGIPGRTVEPTRGDLWLLGCEVR